MLLLCSELISYGAVLSQIMNLKSNTSDVSQVNKSSRQPHRSLNIYWLITFFCIFIIIISKKKRLDSHTRTKSSILNKYQPPRKSCKTFKIWTNVVASKTGAYWSTVKFLTKGLRSAKGSLRELYVSRFDLRISHHSMASYKINHHGDRLPRPSYIGPSMIALLVAIFFRICSLLTALLQFSISYSSWAISEARALGSGLVLGAGGGAEDGPLDRGARLWEGGWGWPLFDWYDFVWDCAVCTAISLIFSTPYPLLLLSRQGAASPWLL